jgi:hypothetical protein
MVRLDLNVQILVPTGAGALIEIVPIPIPIQLKTLLGDAPSLRVANPKK